MLTQAILKKVFPKAKTPKKLFDAMDELFPKYSVDTPERIAGFLAQCGHESGGFRFVEENLNYSAKALDSVFGKYFKNGERDAKKYARKPEEIANVVYANRMGNGDEHSGDGWQFKGRGYIQLTGRNNYTSFAESVDVGLDDCIDYLKTPKGALESALWFWDTNKLNKYCDKHDVKGMTKRVNGGYNGLEDREEKWEKVLELLGGASGEPVEEKPARNTDVVLRIGSTGPDVVAMQQALGLQGDGAFGPGTKRAVKLFQMNNGLSADGIAGPTTLGKLYA
jgi:putative chitinase